MRRFERRMAFFFSMRRCSLLEMNQRLLRMVLKMPLLMTFFRKRRSRLSCDSLLRKLTAVTKIHLLPLGELASSHEEGRACIALSPWIEILHWIEPVKNKNSAFTDTAEKTQGTKKASK